MFFIGRPKSIKNKIKVIMYPIDDMELYKRSLGTVMLDIIEKRYGSEMLELSMQEIKKRIESNNCP